MAMVTDGVTNQQNWGSPSCTPLLSARLASAPKETAVPWLKAEVSKVLTTLALVYQ